MPDSYTDDIKHYVAHAVNDLENRFKQAAEDAKKALEAAEKARKAATGS